MSSSNRPQSIGLERVFRKLKVNQNKAERIEGRRYARLGGVKSFFFLGCVHTMGFGQGFQLSNHLLIWST